jgi:hypothetical protein
MFQPFARKRHMRRQPLRGKNRLNLEALEARLVLASPMPDSYSAVEDTVFATGKTGIALSGPGWKTFDDITIAANAYPENTTQPGVLWNAFDYDDTSNQSFGAWDAPRNAPFAAGTINRFNNDGQSPSPIQATSSNESTFLVRNTFDLPAAAAALDTAGGQILCDDGCIVYLNGVEIFQLGMNNSPARPSTPNTLADTDGGTEDNYVDWSVASLSALGTGLLETGNVLAVEVHQATTTSSDTGFNMSFLVDFGPEGVADNDTPVGAYTVTVTLQPVDGVDGVTPAGTVVMQPDGNFTYTPAANFNGTAVFLYTITDDTCQASCGDTAVEIVVASVNDNPTAVNDFYVAAEGDTIVISSATAPAPYLPRDSFWAYSDDETDQDTLNPTWKAGPNIVPPFDPSSAGWLVGQAPFANIDMPFNTMISYVGGATYYFWTLMDIDGAIPDTLRLRIRRDDCAVVYINGVEALRTGPDPTLPPGSNYQTLCTGAAIGGNDEITYFESAVDAGPLNLQASGNTISVEVHQNSAGSSDVSFDLEIVSGDVGLLANDSDPDGPTLTAVIDDASQLTANGTFTPMSDGTFTFDPNDGVSGNLSFTYHVEDGAGGVSNTATATISITPSTTRPVGVPDTYEIGEGGTLMVTAAASTSYLPRGGTGWSYLDEITNGEDPDGPDPPGTLPATSVEGYPTDAEGDDWFETTFDTSTSTAGIGPWKTGDAPLGGGAVGATIVTTVLGNERAADNNDPVRNTSTTYLFRRLVNIPGGSGLNQLRLELLADDGGILFLNGQQLLRVNMPVVGTTTTQTFAGNAGDENYQTFIVDVTGDLVDGDNLFAFELHQVNTTSSDVGFDLAVHNVAGVLANDTDAQSDPLTAVLVTGPTNAASFALATNGTFNYTPNAGFSGPDTFTYRADDGTEQSADTIVTINVVASCAFDADLNDDGVVDRSDMVILIANYGTTSGATGADGDINCDGAVGLRDLHELQTRLGPVAPSPGAASAIVAAVNDRPVADRATGLDRAIDRVRPRSPLAASRLEQVRERLSHDTGRPSQASEQPADTGRGTSIRASRTARARAHSQAVQELFG